MTMARPPVKSAGRGGRKSKAKAKTAAETRGNAAAGSRATRKRSNAAAEPSAPPRKTAAKSKSGKSAAKGAYSVRIRHYCQGIGDCHLLRFARPGAEDFIVLIDCGVHSSVTGGNDTIAEIAADIARETDRRIDLLVVTHEHWDHLSGFLTSNDVFSTFEIGQIWLGWTENAKDPQARKLDKYKADALRGLQLASSRLAAAGAGNPQTAAIGKDLDSVLGFNFGAKGEKVRSARTAAIDLVKRKESVFYREPGEGPLELDGVVSHRVYVLGPPRDDKLLGITDRVSEMYGLGAVSPMISTLSMRLGGEADAGSGGWTPFDPEIGKPAGPYIRAAGGGDGEDLLTSRPDEADACSLDLATIELLRSNYLGSADPQGDMQEQMLESWSSYGATSPRANEAVPAGNPALTDQSWRRIDNDWLGLAADLAMQLDNRTNNTSLVLAFEDTSTKDVLLFTADAQIGSWMAWPALQWGNGQNKTTGLDLIRRTVYLKVGHHGSRNATRKPDGLELMPDRDLFAFIPVNQADAKKVRWGAMPFQDLLQTLEKKTDGCVVRADDDWLKTGIVPNRLTNKSKRISAARADTSGKGLWIEFDLD